MSRHALADVLCAFVILSAPGVSSAQVAGPSGHWEGSIQVPGQELMVVVDLSGSGDKWEGAIGIPAQGLKAFPLAEIRLQGQHRELRDEGRPGRAALPRYSLTGRQGAVR